MISLDYLKRQQAAERYLRDLKRAEFEKKDKRRRLKNRIILGSLVAVAALTGSKAFAGEANCLARIIYAETSGHSIEHAVAIGQAAITKADDDEVGVCELRGVKRKQPPSAMLEYYKVLAKQLLDKPKQTISTSALCHGSQGGEMNLFDVIGFIVLALGIYAFFGFFLVVFF